MEGIVYRNSSVDVPNETTSLKVEKVLSDSNAILPQEDNTLVQRNGNMKEIEETKQETNGNIENNSETLSNCESLNCNISESQKSFSPTLIGTAIKAMKNLFSPDKQKGKSLSALSPINQQKSASGSPHSSIYVPTIISPELEVETLNNVKSASEENNLKSQLQIELRSQSPLAIEHHNNTDESFLTTVSLIDDSFHSAVTHLDEHAEALKAGAQFMENFFNNSQNLDLLDPYNDTLENNESYLDNTTLKVCNTSALNGDENSGNLNFTQDSGFFNKMTHSNDSEKVQEKVLNSNVQNSPTLELRSSKDEGVCNEYNSSDSTAVDNFEVKQSNATECVEMARLFLNKSFKEATPQNEVNGNNEVVIKENEMEFRCDKGEEGDNVENSISTTTVVLNSDSLEFDKMLRSLKAGDSEDYTPCLTFLEDRDDPALGHPLPYKQSTSSSVTNFSPQLQEKKCVSEGNSPNYGPSCTKIKLNKSDESINRRTSGDPLEGKRGLKNKKSSVDSFMKNREALEVPKVTETFEEHQFRTDESDLLFDKPETLAVVSQQSYTILNHDKKLNRPVIDSVNTSEDLSDKQTFQVVSSDAVVPTESSEKSFVKNCGNTPLNTEDLKSSKLKQSTPLMEGNNESTQKFFRPTALKFSSMNSPEAQRTNDGIEEQKENSLNRSNPELNETIQMFSTNQTSMEISPVNPVNDEQFSKSVERETEGSRLSVGLEPNVTKVLSKASSQIDPKSKPFENANGMPQTVHKLNQTYQKKSPSPGENNGMESEKNKLNETFDKNSPKSKNFNSTFTKSRLSLEESKTFIKPASPEPALMNKTYDKQLNETFDKTNSTSLVDKTHIVEKTSESPAQSQTFIKGDSEKNKTFEVIFEQKESGLSLEITKNSELNNSSKNESCNSEKSSTASVLSTVMLNGEDLGGNGMFDELSEKLGKLELDGEVHVPGFDESDPSLSENISMDGQAEEKLLNCLKDDKLRCDPDLVQLIQEQFSANDIEKICNVVQDLSSAKLSKDIMRASEQFDKSFHGNVSDGDFKPPEAVLKPEKTIDSLSPHSFDFLNSIRGKPTGRDLSRESLYVKFDPLVQPSANSLIDFTKEGEALPPIEPSPPGSHNTSICEQLLAISPKKPGDIVPPLTPLSSKAKKGEDTSERLKELQNEIYFLKNLYAEREKSNRAKLEDYESQITKLTGESCFLENKLKESNDREKALVRKVKEQNQGIVQLNVIMEEYVKVISKLTTELEALKSENKKQIETLSSEKDSYMTHLQNTEAAFSDVHTKYEKSKKTIVSLKTNEAMYRNTIAEQAQKLEEFKKKSKEAQEKALLEFQKVQEELSEIKSNHTQEAARLRAQLRKTELKVEALQESLDQKIKENQQLTAICDELIEGKK